MSLHSYSGPDILYTGLVTAKDQSVFSILLIMDKLLRKARLQPGVRSIYSGLLLLQYQHLHYWSVMKQYLWSSTPCLKSQIGNLTSIMDLCNARFYLTAIVSGVRGMYLKRSKQEA